uniref:Immunoglobulin domain-containing protein n=1 Tax=Periophthalmus magnuspinnatus TaxID=409849 RepID=A0A3B4AW89_9GOBI
MQTLLIWFSLLDICFASVQIHQSPSAVFKNSGEQIEIICSHNRTDYYMMHWYQKLPGDLSMKRIGHINYGSKDYEESLKKHFEFTGDLSGEKAKRASMIIKDVQPEQSAIYYCAASDAQLIHIMSSLYKNLFSG